MPTNELLDVNKFAKAAENELFKVPEKTALTVLAVKTVMTVITILTVIFIITLF